MNKMRCKPGGLAYIIKALRPENVGKPVVTLKCLGYFLISEPISWNGDIIQAAVSDYFWVIESKTGIETLYGPSKQAISPDSWLKPIGDDSPDNVKTTDKTLERV